MLFSEQWLRHYINPDLTSEELAETLTMAGLEVEQMTTIAPPFTGVVVGEILTYVNHENSAYLHVCTVDVGAAMPLQERRMPRLASRFRVPKSAQFCPAVLR